MSHTAKPHGAEKGHCFCSLVVENKQVPADRTVALWSPTQGLHAQDIPLAWGSLEPVLPSQCSPWPSESPPPSHPTELMILLCRQVAWRASGPRTARLPSNIGCTPAVCQALGGMALQLQKASELAGRLVKHADSWAPWGPILSVEGLLIWLFSAPSGD